MLLSAVAALLLTLTPTDSTRASAPPPPAPAAVETWQIDAAHSEVSFRIRHFMSKVRGSFGQFAGTVTVDPADWSTAQANVEIRSASIDTQNDRRDTHLRSPDFFAADSFPTITFRSTKAERQGANGIVLHGELTMRGVTRPVTLEGTLVGTQKDMQGKQRAGIEAKGVVNRMAHGVTWNRVVEGAQMLGEDVEVEITLELVKQDVVGTR
jgi:polyisoprenoid-binding protein YceI